MIVVRTVAEARAALDALPRPLGFTPTMGALHAGHLGLVEAARSRCASVAASIFVNPAQFGRGEDFRRYPRDEARDLRLLEEAGVALVFAPAAAEMYPDGFATAVHVGGPLTESLEGASRPGHFDGVTVIVIKLLGVARPDVLFLGEKDAQQLAVIRRCVRDLDLPVEVDFLEASSYGDSTHSSREVRILKDIRGQIGGRDVLVVELFNPVYTRTFGDNGEEFLTYEAIVLNAYQGEGLEEWVPQADDDQLPAEFTNVSLFIDACADLAGCYKWDEHRWSKIYMGEIPGGP